MVRRLVTEVPTPRDDDQLLLRAGVLIAVGQTPRLSAPDRMHALGCGARVVPADFPMPDSERCDAENAVIEQIAARLGLTAKALRTYGIDGKGEVIGGR